VLAEPLGRKVFQDGPVVEADPPVAGEAEQCTFKKRGALVSRPIGEDLSRVYCRSRRTADVGLRTVPKREPAHEHGSKGEPARSFVGPVRRQLGPFAAVRTGRELRGNGAGNLRSVAADPLMVAPHRTEFDEILRSFRELDGVPAMDVGQESLWIANALAGREQHNLLV